MSGFASMGRAGDKARHAPTSEDDNTELDDQERTVVEPVVDWTPPSVDSGVPGFISSHHPSGPSGSSGHGAAGAAIVAPRRGRRYLELGELGKGGMGIVYTAYDVELDRKVALKVLRTRRRDGKELGNRLKREAQAMAKLSHPNVAQVYDVGETEGGVYIAMERIAGCTLREWSKATTRGWEEVVDVFEQAGRGLAAAHAAGVVHRDFKPDNVMVGDDERVRVLDFGLARRQTAQEMAKDAGLTTSQDGEPETPKGKSRGNVLGTPAYMSPEQHMGHAVDERGDQYAFCVAMYEALYGARPFVARTTEDLAAMKLKGVLAPLEDHRGVPEWLRAVVVRGLAVEPVERHPTMTALIDALRPEEAVPRRRWIWPAIAGALLLVLSGVLARSYLAPPPAEQRERSVIDELTRRALDSGSRGHWVFPPSDEPDASSLRRVLELEELESGASEPAQARAEELRTQFAQSLRRLGDEYWETEVGRGFARDFYVQALMFNPLDDELRARTGMTRGEISDFRDRARQGTFSAEELRAAAVFAALAEADEGTRIEKLEEVIESGSAERSETANQRLEKLVKAKRARTPGLPKPKPEPEPEPLDDSGEVSAGSRDSAEPPDDSAGESGESAGEVSEPAVPKAAKREESVKLMKEGKRAATRGRKKEAERMFNRALDLDPRNAAATIALSDLYFNHSQYTKALKYAKRGVSLSPNTGSYRLRLGDAYFKLSRFSEARREYKAAKRLGVRDADDRLAKVKDALGR